MFIDGTAPLRLASNWLQFAVEPLRFYGGHNTLPPQQDMQPAIAEPPTLLRKPPQLGPKVESSCRCDR